MRKIYEGKEKSILGYWFGSMVMTALGIAFSYCMADLINVAIDRNVEDLFRKLMTALIVLGICQVITYALYLLKNKLQCKWNIELRNEV